MGLGLHNDQVSMSNLRLILLTSFISEIIYTMGFVSIKLSILMLFRHIFPTRLVMVSSVVLSVFVCMWGIALLLVSIFSCNPIHGFWDTTVPSKCVDTKWFFIGNAIPNILADICLLFLPLRDIWQLKLDVRSRVAVSVIFLLGGFVTVASGLRIHFMYGMNSQDITCQYPAHDTWASLVTNCDQGHMSARQCGGQLKSTSPWCVAACLHCGPFWFGWSQNSSKPGKLRQMSSILYKTRAREMGLCEAKTGSRA